MTAGEASFQAVTNTEARRWQQMKNLVDEALDRPAAEREAFLKHACQCDDELRHEVEALLERENDLGDFLARPFFSLCADGAADLEHQLGPYQLIRRLGDGGMGVVYLGERVDGKPCQQVAVKLLKRGLDNEEMVRRFRSERQILENLVHPNITQLLDFGTADDGRPFLAMEYVEGERIDTWCSTRQLSLRERIELFLKVCRVIQFAHQHLVVHRDLKPANILVTAEGTPKLLDFGIATLLDHSSGCKDLATPQAPSPLSLFYSSPEQLTGDPITTATDVFSLGSILYELLTGRRPHQLEGLCPAYAARVLWHEMPLLPSVAAARPQMNQEGESKGEAFRFAKQLRGDIDRILLKALSPNVDRRFSSVEQLSAELHRYLDGLPVRSHPKTLIYRTKKFVRRHALEVITVALVATLVLSLGVAMAVRSQKIVHQVHQMNLEQDRVELERKHAEEVIENLLSFLKSLDPNLARGQALTANEALEKAVAQLGQELPAAPGIRAQLFDALGGVYRNISVYEESRLLLEEALHLRHELYGMDHALVAETMHSLGSLERMEGNRTKAERLIRRAVEIQRRSFPAEDPQLARGLDNLAFLLLGEEEGLEEAEGLLRESIAMKENFFGSKHRELLHPLSHLADLLRTQGELEEAEILYRRCVLLWHELEGPTCPRVAAMETSLGDLLIEQGDLKSAKSSYKEALKIRRFLFMGDEEELVSSLRNLGRVYIMLGDLRSAEMLLEEGIAMARRLNPGQTNGLAAFVEKDLAWAWLELGKFKACEGLARSTLASFRQSTRTQEVAEAQSVLGGCLAGQQRFKEAGPLLSAGYESLREDMGEDALVTRWARKRRDMISTTRLAT